MILGPKKLLQLVKKVNLVEDLAARELVNPEGAGFDLRLGELYTLQGGKAFLGEFERETPGLRLVKMYEKGKRKEVVIEPGDFYIAVTIEKVNTPLDITIKIGRASCRERG